MNSRIIPSNIHASIHQFGPKNYLVFLRSWITHANAVNAVAPQKFTEFKDAELFIQGEGINDYENLTKREKHVNLGVNIDGFDSLHMRYEHYHHVNGNPLKYDNTYTFSKNRSRIELNHTFSKEHFYQFFKEQIEQHEKLWGLHIDSAHADFFRWPTEFWATYRADKGISIEKNFRPLRKAKF